MTKLEEANERRYKDRYITPVDRLQVNRLIRTTLNLTSPVKITLFVMVFVYAPALIGFWGMLKEPPANPVMMHLTLALAVILASRVVHWTNARGWRRAVSATGAITLVSLTALGFTAALEPYVGVYTVTIVASLVLSSIRSVIHKKMPPYWRDKELSSDAEKARRMRDARRKVANAEYALDSWEFDYRGTPSEDPSDKATFSQSEYDEARAELESSEKRIFGTPGSNVGGSNFGDLGEIGAIGERKVGKALEAIAEKYENAMVFHGLRFDPHNKNSRADIDHAILIGRHLYKVDAKMWSAGSYEISEPRRHGYDSHYYQESLPTSHTILRDGYPFDGGNVKLASSTKKWQDFGINETGSIICLTGKGPYEVENNYEEMFSDIEILDLASMIRRFELKAKESCEPLDMHRATLLKMIMLD